MLLPGWQTREVQVLGGHVTPPHVEANGLGPFAKAARLYRDAGWAGVLPLPHGRKWPPPTGWTGADGAFPSDADIQAWIEDQPHANIALRLPHDIIGIDVDAYDGKQGADTLTKLVDQHGELPDTWVSTSRPHDPPNGIRFYRVQPWVVTGNSGTVWPAILGPGIEIIQHSHRYAVAWPSLHPEGREYVWIGGSADWVVPRIIDLGLLPDAWHEIATEPGVSSYTNPDLTQLAEHGIPAGAIQDEVLRDVAWQLAGMGISADIAYITWNSIVSKTALTRPEPWTRRDFDRHWRGAVTRNPPLITVPAAPEPSRNQHTPETILPVRRLSEVQESNHEQLTSTRAVPLWSGLLVALVGEGESCKSLLAGHAALDIAATYPVLVLDGEMSAPAWRQRFTELGADDHTLARIYYLELGGTAADVPLVRATCTRIGVRLIVWDSALSLLARTCRSENDNAEVSRVYDRIREIVRDGPAGLIVDHTARGAENAISRGATAKFNSLDVSYGVRLNGGYPSLDTPWAAIVSVEKDRHGLLGERCDREATFQPLGNRRLHVEVAALPGKASHRLVPRGDRFALLITQIDLLRPAPESGNDAHRRLGGNRKDVLAAYKRWKEGT
jgi:Bifunctional DNA primase/polymerase, N-terminal/AAA domain